MSTKSILTNVLIALSDQDLANLIGTLQSIAYELRGERDVSDLEEACGYVQTTLDARHGTVVQNHNGKFHIIPSETGNT